MKKRVGILAAMAILMGIPFAAKAAEVLEDDGNAVKSYGTIVYEDKNGSVKIYAEDIALLQEKLASVPEEIFDPVLYSHTHVWEYKDITEQSHTKHCAICGSRYDLTNAHSEASEKACTITYGGHDYPGYEKTCECGYTWKTENGHSLVCTPKDENYHTQSCALAGTSYCEGMEKADVPHMSMLHPTDQTHHQERCSECGYQGDIEECVFEYDLPQELAYAEAETEERKYCICGNYTTESKTEITDSAATVTESDVLQQMEEKTEEAGPSETEETEPKPEASNVKPEIPTPSVSENALENREQDKTDKDMMEGENGL